VLVVLFVVYDFHLFYEFLISFFHFFLITSDAQAAFMWSGVDLLKRFFVLQFLGAALGPKIRRRFCIADDIPLI
jgi:hypothetical protein